MHTAGLRIDYKTKTEEKDEGAPKLREKNRLVISVLRLFFT